MGMTTKYEAVEPARTQIDALKEPTVLEFGAPWCGYCRAAQPLIATAFAALPTVKHIKIEDGSGRPLGRSYRVKLWPTLIFLKNGQEASRLVRPTDAHSIEHALSEITA